MAKHQHKESEIDWDALRARLKRQEAEFGIRSTVSGLQGQWMLLNTAFQESDDGILLTDDGGKVLMANRKTGELLERSPTMLTGSSFWALFPISKMEKEFYGDYLQRLAGAGELELRAPQPNKRGLYVRLKHRRLALTGESEVYVLYLRDCTEEVAARIREAERTDLLLQTLEHSNEPFVLLDVSLTVTAFNQAAGNLVQLVSGKALVLGASMLDYPELFTTKERGWQVFREVLAGLVVEEELAISEKENKLTRYLQLTCKPFYDAHGALNGVFMGGQDITTRRSDHKALAERDAYLEVLMAGSTEAMLILDDALNIRFASKAVAMWLGRSESAFHGENIFSLMFSGDYSLSKQRFERLLAAEGRVVTWLFRAVHLHGSLRWLKVRAENHLNKYPISGLVLHIQDETENKLQELERSNLLYMLQQIQQHLPLALLRFGTSKELMWRMLPPSMPSGWEAEDLTLAQALHMMGKKPGPVFRQLAEKRTLTFEITAGTGPCWQVHLNEVAEIEGGTGYVLALADTSWELQARKLEKMLQKITETVTQLQASQVVSEQRWRILADLLALHQWQLDSTTENLVVKSIAGASQFSEIVQLDEMLTRVAEESRYELADQLKGRVEMGDFDLTTELEGKACWRFLLASVGADGKIEGYMFPIKILRENDEGVLWLLEMQAFFDELGWATMAVDPERQVMAANDKSAHWWRVAQLQVGQSLTNLPLWQEQSAWSELFEGGAAADTGMTMGHYFDPYLQRWLFVWLWRKAVGSLILMQEMK
jgi:PAS domain S-box-containing protein